ncbi:tyrosinase family protein [Thalassospira sp. MA62]|nr:tyrosinase family protein [Thalassospira sp. MA62]
MIVAKPTWNDDIRDLLNIPPWIANDRRHQVIDDLANAFQAHCIDISSYLSVCHGAEKIYHFLVSQHLPKSGNPADFWPFDALETFRLWVNQGCRETSDCAFKQGINIQPPDLPVAISKTRIDITTMDQHELDQYRASVDAAMTSAMPDIQSIWHRFADCHNKWHPMDIRQLPMWYRAFLLHFEAETEITVPYWDWTAAWMSDPDNMTARAPQAFLDECYTHPESGEKRPNPLRFALKNRREPTRQDKNGCRDPLLISPIKLGPDVLQRQSSRLAALQGPISELCKDPADINHGNTHPDSIILFAQLINQVGEWAGFDMRPASCDALDPLFLSLCANADRMLEAWLHTVPQAEIQARIPLPPFIGAEATQISETCRSSWRFTSVAQMAQPSKALDYIYGQPSAAPYRANLSKISFTPKGRTALERVPHSRRTKPRPNSLGREPVVVCKNLNRLPDQGWLDVFINQQDPGPEDAHSANMHYAGRICAGHSSAFSGSDDARAQADTAILSAACVFEALGLNTDDTPIITVLVGAASRQNSKTLTEVPEHSSVFQAELIWNAPSDDSAPHFHDDMKVQLSS